MIYELQIRSAKLSPIRHWDTVDWLKGQTSIEFKPGLNIIYGPNGSGKSTLLAGLATLMHCYETNWPVVSRQSCDRFMAASGKYLSGLVLTHDGAPCRYLGVDDPDLAPTTGVTEHKVVLDVPKLKTRNGEGFRSIDRMSHGQATLTKLGRFLRAEPEKTKFKITAKKCTEEQLPLFEVATESLSNVVETKGHKRQQVVLLDEVDRSLDFTKQASVWKQIRALVDDNYQVIIASHSPWAAVQPEAHYIETTPGYLDRTRRALGVLLSNLHESEEPAPLAKRA